MPKYSNLKQSEQKGTAGGFKPVLFFSPVSAITTWGRPIAVPVALGDKVKVTAPHTFAASAAAIRWEAKLHSITVKSAPVGDEGAQELEHTAEAIFLGDNPETFEQIESMLNDQMVIWVKNPNCQESDGYVQLGDDCIPVTVTPEYDSKTTKDGKAEYKITFKSKRKLFYLAELDITA
jgi:hypothetical protein